VTTTDGREESFTVFTTRPDTLFGATFCVLAPEHPLVARITTPDRGHEVQGYVERAARRSERDRIADVKQKTGVFTGALATNPVDGSKVPVWIADYVLATYGTGAVMAVPGHDQRDWEFARAMGLPVREVVSGGDVAKAAHEGDGRMVASGFLDGLTVAEAKVRVTAWLEEKGRGRRRVQYRLRDWLFSRQRYWGEPIPVLHTEDGRVVPVPDEALPVRLPEVEHYAPTGTGESPLAAIASWVNTTDPRSGRPARRETNTMPQWAGSCWYYLRFADPWNEKAFTSPEAERRWLPVDVYIGGAEHAVLHLLYARFWHKVLHDLGLVHTKEPFRRLINQGMILAPSFREREDGPYLEASEIEMQGGVAIVRATGRPAYSVVERMGKSKKNGVTPDEIVEAYGADTLRCYMLFMAGPQDDKVWDPQGIEGVRRFLQRAWRLLLGDERTEPARRTSEPAAGEARRQVHAAIAGVSADFEALGLNTALSKLMVLLNAMHEMDPLPDEAADAFLRMLSPFAPHLAEEAWSRLGRKGLVADAAWPTHDPAALATETVELAVQVNGRVRDRVVVPARLPDAEVLERARTSPKVREHLAGKTVVKEMVVPGRLVVFTVR
jgi:leucyl-tRNA synthetase